MKSLSPKLLFLTMLLLSNCVGLKPGQDQNDGIDGTILATEITLTPLTEKSEISSFDMGTQNLIIVRDERGDSRNSEIYLMNLGSLLEINLSNNEGQDFYPQWSPSGDKIAYMSESNNGEFYLKVVNLDGSEQTQVAELGGVTTFSWSPDNETIVFVYRDKETNLWSLNKVDIDSKEISLLYSDDSDGTFFSDLSWSDTGEYIYFVTHQQVSDLVIRPQSLLRIKNDGTNGELIFRYEYGKVYLERSSNSHLRLLSQEEVNGSSGCCAIFDITKSEIVADYRTALSSVRMYSPKLSPDGKIIVFILDENESEPQIAYYDGLNLVKLNIPVISLGFTAKWFLNGQGFSYSTQTENGFGVFVTDLIGNAPKLVTETQFFDMFSFFNYPAPQFEWQP